MAPVVFRLGLLTAGLAIGELGLESLALGSGIALIQLAFAVPLLVAGSAGFIAPLLRGGAGRKEPDHA